MNISECVILTSEHRVCELMTKTGKPHYIYSDGEWFSCSSVRIENKGYVFGSGGGGGGVGFDTGRYLCGVVDA